MVPILSVVWVCGGTQEFVRFVERACGRESVRVVDTVREMRFGDSTNDVYCVMPRYGRGESVFSCRAADFWRDLEAAARRGCRAYLENVDLSDRTPRSVLGADPYGTDLMAFDRECLEWSDDVLQARNAAYLPVRNHSTSSVTAWVSDCFGAHGVQRAGRHRIPVLVSDASGRILSAYVDFSRYDPHFRRSYALWRKFFGGHFGSFLGIPREKAEGAFSATWPDFAGPSGGTDPNAAVRAAVRWHLESGVMFAPDGSQGMREAVHAKAFGWRGQLRMDVHLMTGALFARAGRKYGREDWIATGKNLVDFMMSRGNQTKEGFYRWFDREVPDFGRQVYANDHGRCALAMINMYRATGERRYLESARKAAEAIDLWRNGRWGTGAHQDDVDAGDWRKGDVNTNPSFYFEAVPFLLQLGDPHYREVAIDMARNVAKRFPDVDGFCFSQSITYARFIQMLACVQASTDEDFSDKLNWAMDYLLGYQTESGGICESKVDLDINVNESGIAVGNGSDHIADILYCNNFAFNAFSVLSKLPAERVRRVDVTRAKDAYRKLRDFLVRIQIKSVDPKFNGAWMRSYDLDIDEYYGMDKDVDWGAYCIECGWIMGYLPLVLVDDDTEGSYFLK